MPSNLWWKISPLWENGIPLGVLPQLEFEMGMTRNRTWYDLIMSCLMTCKGGLTIFSLDMVLGFNGAILDIFLQSSKLLKPARLCVLQNCQDLLELFTLQLFMQTRQVPWQLHPCSAVSLPRNCPQISKVQQILSWSLSPWKKKQLRRTQK